MAVETLRDVIRHSAAAYGSQTAFRYKIGRKELEDKTYENVNQDSMAVSRMLKAEGMLGKHIALIGATTYSWIISYFGITNSGSVAVPIDAQLPAPAICELLNRADVEMVIYDEIRADVIPEIRKLCPRITCIISMQAQESSADIRSLSQLLAERTGNFDTNLDPDQLCTIMFTSGTTGKSKGVMLTQRNLAENATCLDMKIPERTVILSVLPIHHAYCLSMDILKGISLGSVICINDSLMRVVKNIKLFKPEMILMVPLMIETIAKKLQESALIPAAIVKSQVFGKQFHTICSGGAYLDPSYIDLFRKYGITILQGYGMTECSPVISTTVSWNIRKDSVGQLIPNCEAKTVDGELWVRGSSVMQGYYKMPEETAETLEDGWLKTGDLGYADEEGFVYLTGRKKNLIITKNGENVSPEELENQLSLNRLVGEVLVREAEGVIEAEIYPDQDYIKKKHVKDVEAALQKVIDDYNQGAPLYKRIYRLKIRDTEFEKTTSRKIKRF